ncbi:hypothetical protein D3C78_1928580 [compost metagenome]
MEQVPSHTNTTTADPTLDSIAVARTGRKLGAAYSADGATYNIDIRGLTERTKIAAGAFKSEAGDSLPETVRQ